MANYRQDVTVTYGNFTFPMPTPYVSKTLANEFIGGDLWATKVNVRLNGKIALLTKRDDASGNNYLRLAAKRDAIARAFAGELSQNFKKFTVSGHGTSFTLNNCVVENVSFDSSNYVGLVGYSVEISGYKNDEDFYSANYGVLDPVDSWAYVEGSDGTASATHVISAKGYNTSEGQANAFLNAKSFVTARKGSSSNAGPALINMAEQASLILTNLSETVNRLGGSYSITENYSFVTNDSSETKAEEANLPLLQTSNIMLTYTADISEDQRSDYVGVNISGAVVGSKESDVSWSDIKADLKSRDLYDLADKAYRRYLLGSGGSRVGTEFNEELNKEPVSFSLSPDEVAKTIQFQIAFDNNKLFEQAKIKYEDSYFDYELGFEHDNITDIIQVSCRGQIRTRGPLEKKNTGNKVLLDLMLEKNSKMIRDEAQDWYDKMFPARDVYRLSPRPSGLTVNRNEFDGTINYEASFSDKDYPENSELRNLTYGIQVTPPYQEYRSVPSALQNGHYAIYDLNLKTKRELVSIGTNGTGDERTEKSLNSAKTEIKSINKFLEKSFVDGEVIRLDNEGKSENKDSVSVSYNRTLSHQKAVEVVRLDRLNT